jgi:hypothetical protein
MEPKELLRIVILPRLGRALLMKLNEEARLLLRINHLRTLRRYTEEDQIVVVLDEFIADTETEIVTLKPSPTRKATLH